MHSYASGLTNRTQITYLIALISVGFFFAIGILVERFGLSIPFYVGTPSSGLFFFVLFASYDKYLWRARWFGFRFSQLVDLNGTYVGYVIIKTELNAAEVERMPCWVHIGQTWSKISIRFETAFSRSQSSMAALDDPTGPYPQMSGLRYYFQVEPKQEKAVPGMNVHSGLARLYPENKDWSIMDGDWFNDFGFHRFGAYHLERLPSEMDVASWLASQPVSL
jgi:hypothetical protein